MRRRAFLSTLLPTVLLTVALALASAACGAPPAGGEEDGGAAPPPKATPRATGFPLTDVTAASGIAFVHDNGAAGRHHYVETMGPGVALFDADGDHDLDVYVVDGGPLPGSPARGPARNRLYRNRGDGTFEEVPDGGGAGDEGYGMGCTVGDVDGDGDLDLYVLNLGPNALYLNDGGGRFTRTAAGVEDPAWSVSGAFFDLEGDGDLDLYVANYLRYDVTKEQPCKVGTLEIYCSPEQYAPAPDRLFRNDGGRFTDVSETAGVAPDGRGMGVVAGDVDGDGRTDLYVANDRTQNFLYLNRGGRLDEVAAESGVGYSATGQLEGGMGVALTDFTGDGESEIFVTNFQKEPNRLYVPIGAGFYDDWSAKSGLGFPSTELVGWGIGAFDLEGDGDLDLAVANGHVFDNAAEFIPGSAFALPDHFYVNGGAGVFTLAEFPGEPHSSRGLATGDVDGDGDPDLVVTSCGGPLQVWRNDAGVPGRFLVLELAAPPNASAYGAVVTVEVGGRRIRREVTGGGSYASHSDLRLYIGLGDAPRADRLEVRWPDGTTEAATAVDGGQAVVWRQGAGIVERRRFAGGGAP